jgi:hypothetical protein
MKSMRTRILARLCISMASALFALWAAACAGPPRDAFQQYVARDAWDVTCAEQAMIEKWVTRNGRWKTDETIWVVDVEATFKMANECTSSLPAGALAYKQFQTIPFTKTVEMVRCKNPQGDAGWALPGRESSRCWTGPTLVK